MTITLATLPSASAQEVFDHVVRHAYAQRVRSMLGDDSLDAPQCAYRNWHGLACFAGCMIADDEYRASMEGKPWCVLCEDGIAPSTHANLITQLQRVHDSYMPSAWPPQLRVVAATYHLSPALVDKLQAENPL